MILIATPWQLHNHLVEEALSLGRPVVMKLQSVTNVLLPQVSVVFYRGPSRHGWRRKLCRQVWDIHKHVHSGNLYWSTCRIEISYRGSFSESLAKSLRAIGRPVLSHLWKTLRLWSHLWDPCFLC